MEKLNINTKNDVLYVEVDMGNVPYQHRADYLGKLKREIELAFPEIPRNKILVLPKIKMTIIEKYEIPTEF